MIRLTLRLARLSVILIVLVVMIALVGSRIKQSKADGLAYKGPVEISVKSGETLSGTDIQYVGVSDERAEFTIDDMQALKKVGDSLKWEGDPVTGAHLELALRLLLINEDTVHTAGTMSLQIAEPQIQEGSPRTAGTKFTVPVTYGLKPGETIPGTLITYEGRDPEKGAQLGIEGYPYRNVGDSVVWTGQLNDQVGLTLDLRVLYFSDKTLRLGGVATLWLDENVEP